MALVALRHDAKLHIFLQFCMHQARYAADLQVRVAVAAAYYSLQANLSSVVLLQNLGIGVPNVTTAGSLACF